jgi:hypothetical protein
MHAVRLPSRLLALASVGALLGSLLTVGPVVEAPAQAAAATDTLKPIGASASGSTSVTWNSGAQEYVLHFSDGSDTIDYTLSLTGSNFQTGLIDVEAQLNSNPAAYPIHTGGTRYWPASGSTPMAPDALAAAATVTLTSHSLSSNVVTMTFTDDYQSVVTTKTYRFSIEGKTLVMRITSSGTAGTNNYAGIDMGASYLTSNVKSQSLSYAEDQPSVMVDHAYFYSVVADRFQSDATSTGLVAPTPSTNSIQASYVSSYDRNSAGTVNALDETYYLTLSNDVMDTVYKTSKTASSERDTLTDYVALNMWQEGSGYADDARDYNGMQLGSRADTVDRLADAWGMDKVLLIDHQWQYGTYDVQLPVHYPASPMSGTSAEYAAFVSDAKSEGWLAALHEDYWYMYPDADNKYYDPAGPELSRNADLTVKDAWYMADFTLMTKAIRAEKMIDFFNLESAQIAAGYAPDASYLDVNSAWRPDYLNQITLDASDTDSRSARDAIIGNKTLFDAMRDTYSGPVSGEGGNGQARFDSAYAGYVDAVARDLTPGSTEEGSPVILDYELVHIRPLMANQGMGLYDRFLPSNPTQANWDTYYAMMVAFGHTGLMTTDGNYSRAGKMYYLSQALQSQYLDTSVSVSSIGYWNGSSYLTVSQAMKADYDFAMARVKVVYSNGLEVFANFGSSTWTVSHNSTSYSLDKSGWVAGNVSAGFLAHSSVVSGHRVDYVDSADYTYADARGTLTSFPGFTTSGQKLVRKGTGDSTAPTVRDVKVTGVTDTTATVTWTTNEYASQSIQYGTTTSYGSTLRPPLDFTTAHSMTLTGLSANTAYHFKVTSDDNSGNSTTSGDFVVVTRPSGATAGTQFSSTQGSNGWSYLSWNGSSYANLTWNSTDNVWKAASDANAYIGSTYQHPGSSLDTVRKWTASTSGWYQVSGDFYKSNVESPWNASAVNGDGVNLSIKLDDSTVWSTNLQSQEREVQHHDVVVYLTSGDALYFGVNKNVNNGYDGVTWSPSVLPLATSSYTVSTGFSADNGRLAWYPRTWDGSTYREMAYGSGTWTEGSASIGSDWLAPSTSRVATRMWVSTFTGEIRVAGNPQKKVTGGDGVTASITLNGTQTVWSSAIAASDTTGVNHDLVLHVEPGDLVEFRVASGATATSDSTTWDPTISFEKPYDSAADLSSTQGTRSWYYQKWSGSSYSNLTWNTNKWEYTGTYLAVDATNMHPESTYDAVRKWVAPNDGRVTVSGTIQRPAGTGDGIVATTLLNGTTYWSQSIAGSDTGVKPFSYDITVQAGDALYFRVNRNSTIVDDTTTWQIDVNYSEQRYDAVADFSSTQGLNGWNYLRRSGGTDTALTWSTDHWQYSTYLSIYPMAVHPENSYSAVRAWTAPFTGTVEVDALAKINSAGGDGVGATILKNGTTLWSRTISGMRGGYLPDAAFAPSLLVDVTAGDVLYFVLDKNSTLTSDGSTFFPTITYTSRH